MVPVPISVPISEIYYEGDIVSTGYSVYQDPSDTGSILGNGPVYRAYQVVGGFAVSGGLCVSRWGAATELTGPGTALCLCPTGSRGVILGGDTVCVFPDPGVVSVRPGFTPPLPGG
jgi:hypothetical protein